jgi:hypothetical protein
MTIVIEPRYSGPPNCGNGGYVAGRIAAHVDGPVEVTLRNPTPLLVPLAVDRHADGVRVSHDETVIATATTTADRRPAVPDPVSLIDAWTAGQNSPLRQHPESHPFPGCFVCGPKSDGGLQIMVGHVPGRDLAADIWTPDVTLAGSAEVRPEFVWAALDCSGGLGAIGPEPASAPYLLGRITTWLSEPVNVGEPYIVVGWREHDAGRKLSAGSALYTATGRAVAVAEATWIRLA